MRSSQHLPFIHKSPIPTLSDCPFPLEINQPKVSGDRPCGAPSGPDNGQLGSITLENPVCQLKAGRLFKPGNLLNSLGHKKHLQKHVLELPSSVLLQQTLEPALLQTSSVHHPVLETGQACCPLHQADQSLSAQGERNHLAGGRHPQLTLGSPVCPSSHLGAPPHGDSHSGSVLRGDFTGRFQRYC